MAGSPAAALSSRLRPSVPAAALSNQPLPSATSRFPQPTALPSADRRCPQPPAAALIPDRGPQLPVAVLSPRLLSSAPDRSPQLPVAALSSRLLPSAPGCGPQAPAGGAQPAPGERPDGPAVTEQRHRAPPALPPAPCPHYAPRGGAERAGPAAPVGRGEGGAAGLRCPPHSSRPDGMEGQLPGPPSSMSFADDVLSVFGANHSLSAGQLSSLLQRLGAAPVLGSALSLAHLHHNQVPAPRGWKRPGAREPAWLAAP